MKYFDLHCDTIQCAYNTQQALWNNTLHVSLEKTAIYERYSQLLAVYSRPALSDDECYERFFKVVEHYRTQQLPDNFTGILAIECGKLLGGRLERVDELYKAGVRFMTMVWGSRTCIGSAHNDPEDIGYTEFGLKAARRCFEVGIVPDMSHCSDKLFWQTSELADEYKKPFIATHSNSRTLRNIPRNLSDDMFKAIVKANGIVGVSMVRKHLCEGDVCGMDQIRAVIEHYLSLGGEKTVCMGCDLDGTNPLPDGLTGVGDIYKIADHLAQHNYSQSLIDDIFYNNANNFMLRNGILQ
nr:membrane dipeptidase [Clostridia bacterium]